MSQSSFSTLWNGYATAEEARAMRNRAYRKARSMGLKARRWVLRNQVRPYAAMGVPDGRIADVYMLDIEEVQP